MIDQPPASLFAQQIGREQLGLLAHEQTRGAGVLDDPHPLHRDHGGAARSHGEALQVGGGQRQRHGNDDCPADDGCQKVDHPVVLQKVQLDALRPRASLGSGPRIAGELTLPQPAAQRQG